MKEEVENVATGQGTVGTLGHVAAFSESFIKVQTIFTNVHLAFCFYYNRNPRSPSYSRGSMVELIMPCADHIHGLKTDAQNSA